MYKIAFVIIKTWCVWYSDIKKIQIFLNSLEINQSHTKTSNTTSKMLFPGK